MKLSVTLSAALLYSSTCAAVLKAGSPEVVPRDSTTCSIGIGRDLNSLNWDVTVYNVPQPLRQDVNIVSTLKHAFMDEGGSITVKGPSQDIKITNKKNTPVFDYSKPDLVAPLDNQDAETKVLLNFEMGDTTWDTSSCSPNNVVFASRESWSCDFPCTLSSAKEL